MKYTINNLSSNIVLDPWKQLELQQKLDNQIDDEEEIEMEADVDEVSFDDMTDGYDE